MTTADQDQGPPPWESLIRLAREAQAISPETAAARMPFRFSGSSWRQIEAGYKGKARKPVRGNASTVAHMARVVGVTAARLAAADREDAARILREVEVQEAQQGGALPDPLDKLEPWRQRAIVELLGQFSQRDRGPALRRLAERVEAGELELEDPSEERPRQPGGRQRPTG